MHLWTAPSARSPPTHTFPFHLRFPPACLPACSALADCQMGLKYDPSLMRCALRVATCHRWVGGWVYGSLEGWWAACSQRGAGLLKLQLAIYNGSRAYPGGCARGLFVLRFLILLVLCCLNEWCFLQRGACCSRMGDFDEAFKVLAGLRDQAGGARAVRCAGHAVVCML
jgi:hypothetical protein